MFFARALFVICDEHIRVFSTITGECIRGLEGIENNKIISQQFDLFNPKILFSCTESGDIISWKWKSSVLNQRQRLKFPSQQNAIHTKCTSFSLIRIKGTTEPYALVTWIQSGSFNTEIAIFNLSNGKQEMKTPLILK